MTTQNTNSQNRKPKMKNLAFIEYPKWEKGQHFLTVMEPTPDGKRKIGARVYKEYDKEKKQCIYTAKDKEGKEIYPPDNNLYALKKKFIDSVNEKIRRFTQSLVPEKFTSDQPEVDKVMEDMQREHELKDALVEKDKPREKKNELPDKPRARENELKDFRKDKENGKSKDKGLSR